MQCVDLLAHYGYTTLMIEVGGAMEYVRHPETYPLVFDLLEEVLDVFAPSSVNIGHDEYYSIGMCRRGVVPGTGP